MAQDVLGSHTEDTMGVIEPPTSDRVAMLLDAGAFALGAGQQARTRSGSLVDATRWLLIKYRAHRIRPVVGGSDAYGVPDSDGVREVPRVADVATRPADGTRTLPLPRGVAGGLARAAKLTPEQRQEIASKAAKARWARFRNGGGTGPPDPRLGGLARAQSLSAERRQEIAHQGARAMHNRARHGDAA